MSSHTLSLLWSCYCSMLLMPVLFAAQTQRIAEIVFFSLYFASLYFCPVAIERFGVYFSNHNPTRNSLRADRNSFATTILRVSYSRSFVRLLTLYFLRSSFYFHTWCNTCCPPLSLTHTQTSRALTLISARFLFSGHLFHFILILVSQLKAHLSEDTTRMTIYSRCVLCGVNNGFGPKSISQTK